MTSDTPQTDDLARGNHVVPTEFACELERQLRTARERCLRLARERNRQNNLLEQMAQSIRSQPSSLNSQLPYEL